MTFSCNCGYKTEDPNRHLCPYCKVSLSLESKPSQLRKIGQQLHEVELEEAGVDDDYKESMDESSRHTVLKTTAIPRETVDDSENYKEDIESSNKHSKVKVTKLSKKKK